MAARKYLYEAKDAAAKARSGYVEAATFADARTRFAAQGLTDIVVIDDDLTADLRAFAEPTAWGMAWVALKKGAVWNIVSLLVAAWLWAAGSPVWAGALIAVTLLPALFPAWLQWRQNEIAREFWRGNYDASERIARKLRGMGFIAKVPTVLLELDSRIAGAMVKRGDLQGALAVLAPWESSDKVPHATYLIKVATCTSWRAWATTMRGPRRCSTASIPRA